MYRYSSPSQIWYRNRPVWLSLHTVGSRGHSGRRIWLWRLIKKWIPELHNVPEVHIHEPWKMTAMEQTFCGVTIGEDYPAPIVDLQASAKIARDKIWGHKKHPAVQQEKKRLLNTHVNRANNDLHKKRN